MPDDEPSDIYSAKLTGEPAAEIEAAMEEEDISKSQALRDLVNDGLKYRDEQRHPHFFERVIEQATAVAFAAGGVLFFSFLLLGVLGRVGLAVEFINAGELIVAASVTILVACLGILFRLAGISARLDGLLGRAETYIEVRL